MRYFCGIIGVKGGRIMFKLLSEKEVEEFTNTYLPDWLGDIFKISRIEYKGTSEYLVNDHYLITIKNSKIVKKEDLQELIYK